MGDWRFLKKEDCEPPITLTNAGVIEKNCARNGDEPDLQWCLSFERHKGVVPLRPTVRKMVARLLGSNETDDWIGKDLEWYVDPNVEVRGERKGGIRPRLPRKVPVPASELERELEEMPF